MGRTRVTVPMRMTLAQHEALGEVLGQMSAEAVGVRQVVRAHFSSASAEYLNASRLLRAIADLRTALVQAALGEFGDQVPRHELTKLYPNGEGQGAGPGPGEP